MHKVVAHVIWTFLYLGPLIMVRTLLSNIFKVFKKIKNTNPSKMLEVIMSTLFKLEDLLYYQSKHYSLTIYFSHNKKGNILLQK